MATPEQKTRYELTVELIKAIAWPLFAFFVLFSFWQPLHLAMEQVPDIVSKSDTITIAGLSIKIDRSLQLQGLEPSSEVRQTLAKLTPDSIRILLGHSESAYWKADSEASGRNENAQLVALGLVKELSQQELNQKGGDYVYGIHVTPLGKETQKYLYALISEFVDQLNQPKSTPAP